MNILYLNDYPLSISFGGKEVQMFQYLDAINKLYNDNCKVQLLDYWSFDAFKDIDILHVFGHSVWYSNTLPILKSKFPHLKIIISPTFYKSSEFLYVTLSYIFQKIPVPNYLSMINKILHFSDAIITNSEAEKVQLHRLFPQINLEKFKTVYNAIESNFNQFNNANNSNLFLTQYKIEPGYFLSVSFFENRKNTLNLIKAYLNTFKQTKKKLVLIGKNRFDNKEKFNEVNDLIARNKEKIIHIDYLERNSDILKSAYLHSFAHLMPSLIETPGISNLEAASFAKNILVGKCKPVEEYFQNFAVYPKSKHYKDIETAILKINSQQSVNLELQNLVLTNYNIENSISKLIEIYKKIL